MNYLREKISYNYIYLVIIFMSMFVFFSQIHPLVPYDGDDWTYMGYIRSAVPLWGNWNPTRIFPETFMPICSYIAVYFVKPIIGNYIYSLIVVYALVMSIFITGYIFLFNSFIKKQFNLNDVKVNSISVIFFLFHFVIFDFTTNNIYMFFSPNLTCYFYYVLPNLLNFMLVFFFCERTNADKKFSYYKLGVILLAIYLAVFSNLFSSIIILSYVLAKLIIYFVINIKKFDFNFYIQYLKNNKIFITIIFLGMVSLIFEANGGRASNIGKSLLEMPVLETIKNFRDIIVHLNKEFIYLFVFINMVACIIYLKEKTKSDISKKYKIFVIEMSLSSIIMLIYLILLSAKVNTSYIARIDVFFGVFVYLFVIEILSLVYILYKKEKAAIFLPIILYIILCQTLVTSGNFRESNISRATAQSVISVDNYLIEQIIESDKNFSDEMILYVPKGDNIDNWPHPMYMGDRISNTLYKHGLISKPIKIKIKPNETINKQYNINIPK